MLVMYVWGPLNVPQHLEKRMEPLINYVWLLQSASVNATLYLCCMIWAAGFARVAQCSFGHRCISSQLSSHFGCLYLVCNCPGQVLASSPVPLDSHMAYIILWR